MSSIKWKNDQVVVTPVSKSQSFQCPIIEAVTFYLEQGFTPEEIIELGQKEEGLTNMDLLAALDDVEKSYMF